MNKFFIFTFAVCVSFLKAEAQAFLQFKDTVYLGRGDLKEITVINDEGTASVYSFSPRIDKTILNTKELDFIIIGTLSKDKKLNCREGEEYYLGRLEKPFEIKAPLLEEKKWQVVVTLPVDSRVWAMCRSGSNKELLGVFAQVARREKKKIKIESESEADVLSPAEVEEEAQNTALRARIQEGLEKMKKHFNEKDFKNLRVEASKLKMFDLHSSEYRALNQILALLPVEEKPMESSTDFEYLHSFQGYVQYFHECAHEDLAQMTIADFEKFLINYSLGTLNIESKQKDNTLDLILMLLRSYSLEREYSKIINKDVGAQFLTQMALVKINDLNLTQDGSMEQKEALAFLKEIIAATHQYIQTEDSAKSFVKLMTALDDLKKSNWPHYKLIQEKAESTLRRVISKSRIDNNQAVLRVFTEAGMDLSLGVK